jgi:hypothetical protein
MNTSGMNPPAIVISVVLLVAALLIATLSHGVGLFFAYLLPGVLLLGAALTPVSLLMAKQWEKAVVLRFGKLHAIRGPPAVCHHPVHGCRHRLGRSTHSDNRIQRRTGADEGHRPGEHRCDSLKAGNIYARNPAALQLRAMNIIYETTKERGATILIPSAMVDCMNPGGIMGLACAAPGPASPALPA